MDENRLKKVAFGGYFVVYFLWNIFAPQNLKSFGKSLILLIGIGFITVMIFSVSKKLYDYRAYGLILGVSMALYFMGDASWMIYELNTGDIVSMTHISTFFYVTESIFVCISLWWLIVKKSTRWNRIQYGVDGIFSAVFIFYIAWKLVFKNINSSAIESMFELEVLLTYVIVDFFVILGSSILFNSKNNDYIDKITSCALVMWSFTDMIYYWLFLTKSYDDSSILDIFWVLTFFILWYTLEHRVLKNELTIKKYSDFEQSEKTYQDTPMSLVVLFFIAFVLSYDESLMMFVFVIILILRKGAAQFINTYLVNEYLTKEYKKLNEILEEKVTERTNELKRKNEELYILANIDSLTGLPNRRHFSEYLDYTINTNIKENLIAVLLIDLDRFKSINDWYGHEVGDKLLLNVAQRLKSKLLSDNFIARLGGDEFVIVLNNVDSREDAFNKAMIFVEAFREHFKIGDSKINSTLSIGISICPLDGSEMSILLKQADTALYCAKEEGKNRAVLYDSSMKKEETIKLELEGCLYDSIKNNELTIEYRPQLSTSGESILGIDTRIVWNSSKFGRLSYDEFKFIAEDSGFIMDIGLWTIDSICKNIEYFKYKFNLNIRFSLEISTNQFLGSDIVSMFEGYISKYNIEGNCFEVEIYENFSERDENIVIEKLNGLKNLGIMVSIIDFGVGYSSLNHFRNYPIDNIKIPSKITENIVVDKGAQKLVKAAVALSNIFELKSIAQGVKHIEQAEVLKTLGCDEVRGSYYSDFVDFKSIEKIIGEYK